MRKENIPVIVGTGQLVDRDADLDHFIEPLEMLVRVARLAEEEAGSKGLLEKLDTIALVGTAGWNPQNAPNMLANKLCAKPAKEIITGIGGQVGITLLNHLASNIIKGESELGLVAGCNNLRTLTKAVAAKQQLDWSRGGSGEPLLVDGNQAGSNELEGEYGLNQPPDIYPLFENAHRARLGLGFEEHNERMGRLFSGFTEIAASNPYAWFPTRRTAEELTSVTPENRMISFPYTKFLNAILNTEQAAGLIICSAAKAESMGISLDRCVYWWGGAHSQEKAWWASERPDFTQCPSMKDTHLSTLQNANLGIDEINLFDFYSCFPVAVEMACDMLELDVTDSRGFSVTGGLPYAGGPASAYTLHSLAEMVRGLREQSGSKGMVTGNGWYLTKHSSAILSSEPKPGVLNVSGLVKNLPSMEMETEPKKVDLEAQGTSVVEAYTVSYNREGDPVKGVVLGHTQEGNRFLANTSDDLTFLNAFVAEEQIGRSGNVHQVNGKSRFEPE